MARNPEQYHTASVKLDGTYTADLARRRALTTARLEMDAARLLPADLEPLQQMAYVVRRLDEMRRGKTRLSARDHRVALLAYNIAIKRAGLVGNLPPAMRYSC
jgi:hypothetical protein